MSKLELAYRPFLAQDELFESFLQESKNLKHIVEGNIRDQNSDNSRTVSKWLEWCKAQTGRISVIGHNVPLGILNENTEGCLYDIQVRGKRRAPDDALYNSNPDLR